MAHRCFPSGDLPALSWPGHSHPSFQCLAPTSLRRIDGEFAVLYNSATADSARAWRLVGIRQAPYRLMLG